MREFDCLDGHVLEIGDITVTVLDVSDDEVLLRIDGPEDLIIEPAHSNLVIQSEWRLD